MSHYSLAVFCHDPDDLDEIMAPFKEDVYEGSPYAVFMADDEGEETNHQTGEKGRWYNPNARWDWWMEGGSWAGAIKIKPGCDGRFVDEESDWVNGAAVDDIDIEQTRKEDMLPPYAFIDEERVWHAPGVMGWFGCDDSTEASKEAYKREFWEYLESARGLYIIIVDCHI